MTRRELLQIAGSSAIIASLPASLWSAASSNRGQAGTRLFFDLDEVDRIRRNAGTKLLGPLFEKWSGSELSELKSAFDKFDQSGDVVRDFAAAVGQLTEKALVQIVTPTEERRDALINAIERLIAYEKWDYFLDGDRPIGIQRASMANVRLLFAREVLAGEIDDQLDRAILDAVAEKGCLPCYRTVNGMNNPDTVEGWGFDDRHALFYDITMERWPMILGANNLRGAPTNALGLGAIALQGHDSRAQHWLDTAVDSARRVLDLFSPDGSYFEGLSYSGYTLRTILNFCDAHQRAKGDIDWSREANLDGMIDFFLSMQAGKNADGTPDIVNFSDARTSVYPCAPAWIGKQTSNPLAQYAVENATVPAYFLDFLWYEPKRKSTPPPASLLNVRNDLDWILCRSGWEANDAVLAFRSGGPCNHEHADRNHITYKVFGERLLTDLFGAAYDKRHPGWVMRHTVGHNSVLVNRQGQHYPDGNEGTNDSKSYAAITQYEDHGDIVWWTSDATAAYIFDNDHVSKVLRTVIFAKPDVLVVIDQIRLHFGPQRVDLRFYPDNRDGAAKLTTEGDLFGIARPNANLHGTVYSRSKCSVAATRLDVPADTGDFPCIEVTSPSAYAHEIVTVLTASKAGSASTPCQVIKHDDGWRIRGGRLNAKISTEKVVPAVSIL